MVIKLLILRYSLEIKKGGKFLPASDAHCNMYCAWTLRPNLMKTMHTDSLNISTHISILGAYSIIDIFIYIIVLLLMIYFINLLLILIMKY